VTTILIKLFATLRLTTGIQTIDFSGESEPSVDELIDVIQDRVDAGGTGLDVRRELLLPDGRIRPGTILLIDGHNVLHADGLTTRVPSGSALSVFPPVGGG